MRLLADVSRVLRDPAGHWHDGLPCRDPAVAQLLAVALPLSALSGLAVLVRSLVAGNILAGVVLGVGSVVLQLGCWLGLGLVLPALARQFRVELTDRNAFALATWGLVPMWLASLLLVVPETYWVAVLWSRLLLLLASLYGLVIFHRGLVALDTDRQVRPALVASAAATTAVLYLVLSASLGVTTHVVLYVLSG